MITIVNNCLQFVELAQLMKQHYWRPGLHDNEAGAKFEALLTTFQVSRRATVQFGLSVCFVDEMLINSLFVCLLGYDLFDLVMVMDNQCVLVTCTSLKCF